MQAQEGNVYTMTDRSLYTTETVDNPTQALCGAKTRSGQPCQNPPVTGKSRCRMHGGAAGSGRPPTHGLYSKVLRQSLADKYLEFLEDPDYMSLAKELAVARALLSEYLSRFREGVRLKGEDIESLAALIDKIGRLAERMNRIESRTALTAREVQLLTVLLARELVGEAKAAAFVEHLSDVLAGEGLLTSGQVIEGQWTEGG